MQTDRDVPLQSALSAMTPAFWVNPQRVTGEAFPLPAAHQHAVDAASDRLQRFAPLLARLFPELEASGGVIESPLLDAGVLATSLDLEVGQGRLLVKGDHLLPVAGSIKARGGIHAVLVVAEEVARRAGLLDKGSYLDLASPKARSTFAQHTLAVGSTGNLGLSVGTLAAALGFRTVVHMSVEAKGWKKERLLRLGVEVVEHSGDYESALAAGRAQCADDPVKFFIDDEDSLPLLYGYATAIGRLKRQLEEIDIMVDRAHPLFIYVPCGVGGAPAGIALGLRLAFGPWAHCFYAEPVGAPCMALALAGEQDDLPSIYQIGLTGETEADGLAVPRASRCAVDVSRPLVSGVFTVRDETMFRHMALAHRVMNMRLEPSAAAGLSGPSAVAKSTEFRRYLEVNGLSSALPRSTHVVWATGGRLIPDDQFARILAQA